MLSTKVRGWLAAAIVAVLAVTFIYTGTATNKPAVELDPTAVVDPVQHPDSADIDVEVIEEMFDEKDAVQEEGDSGEEAEVKTEATVEEDGQEEVVIDENILENSLEN